MIKDPMWRGLFPYDALAPAGITPESSMREVRDASFDLMARGLMSSEVRQAWDELRTVDRRQVVDFLLYPVDLAADVEAARRALEEDLEQWGETPDPSPLMGFEEADLSGFEDDFRPLEAEPVAVRFPADFDRFSPFPKDDFVELDR